MERFTLAEPHKTRFVSIQYINEEGKTHGEEYVADRGQGPFIVDGSIEFIEINRATGEKTTFPEVYTIE